MNDIRRDFSLEACSEIRSIINEVKDESQWGICDWFDDMFMDELNISEYINNINEYRSKMIDKHDMDLNEFEKILTKVKELDVSYAIRLQSIDGSMWALDKKINDLTSMITGRNLSLSNTEYSNSIQALNSKFDNSIVEMNRVINREVEEFTEHWYDEILSFVVGTGTAVVLDNMQFLFDVAGTGLNILPDDIDYTLTGDKTIEDLEEWAKGLVPDEEFYYYGKVLGNAICAAEGVLAAYNGINLIVVGLAGTLGGGILAVADGPLPFGEGVTLAGVGTVSLGAGLVAEGFMFSVNSVGKIPDNISKARNPDNAKLRDKIDELEGKDGIEKINNPNVVQKKNKMGNIVTDYTNPSGNKIRFVEQREKTIPKSIESKLKNPKQDGDPIEAKVAKYINEETPSKVTAFGQKVQNMTTGDRAGDIDVGTNKCIIEVKKSVSAIKIEQMRKYIDNNNNNYFNHSNKKIIYYIDETINMSDIDDVDKINQLKEAGVTVVNSLEELKGVIE